MAAPTSLLTRLAALRQRLAVCPDAEQPAAAPASPHQQLLLLEQQIAALRAGNSRLEQGLRSLDEVQGAPPTPANLPRLSPRCRHLLLRGRLLVDRLRALMPEFTGPNTQDTGPALYFKATQDFAEFTLRTSEYWPEQAAAQDILADGLEAGLTFLEERVRRLAAHEQRQREARTRLEMLAEAIQQLLRNRPVTLSALRPLALGLIDEEGQGSPPCWWPCDPRRPARWAAASGLNAALVMVRIVRFDSEWATRQLDAVLAALLHDAGMASLPAELLANAGPLTDEQRRQVETHVGMATDALRGGMPGETWLLDAVRGHHERPNGTGYPAGQTGSEIARLAKLLAVSSTYAALSTPRPWRAALDPREALTETLLEAQRGKLDVGAAELLLHLGQYPVGTLVELSDGCFAVVVGRQGAHDLRPSQRPIVRLLRDPRGKPLGAEVYLDHASLGNRQIVKGFSQDEARRLIGLDTLDVW